VTLEQAKEAWLYWHNRRNDPYRDAYCESDYLREQEALAAYLTLLHEQNELQSQHA